MAMSSACCPPDSATRSGVLHPSEPPRGTVWCRRRRGSQLTLPRSRLGTTARRLTGRAAFGRGPAMPGVGSSRTPDRRPQASPVAVPQQPTTGQLPTCRSKVPVGPEGRLGSGRADAEGYLDLLAGRCGHQEPERLRLPREVLGLSSCRFPRGSGVPLGRVGSPAPTHAGPGEPGG
jgi:hypothetical protein